MVSNTSLQADSYKPDSTVMSPPDASPISLAN